MKSETWQERKLEYLNFFYKKNAERWKNEHDDRRLYSNLFYMIIEAIKSLGDNEPHIYISIALNNEIEKDIEQLDRIAERFKGR